MRLGLLVSLIVHGAAAAALVLWGAEPRSTGPLGWIAASAHAEDAPEPERAPDEPPPIEAPTAPAEFWPAPEEAPSLPEIEAPEVLHVRSDPLPAVVRLRRPLSRPARKAAGAVPPARAIVAPVPVPVPVPVPAPAPTPAARDGVVREPRLLPDSPRASYPARARRLGLEGTVVLLLHVAADGTVQRVEVVTSSGHEMLDKAAAEAAALWRFEPARRHGVAIAYAIRQPVEFTLADA